MTAVWETRGKAPLLPQTRLKALKNRRRPWLALAAAVLLLWIVLSAVLKKRDTNKTTSRGLLAGSNETSQPQREVRGLYKLSARDITGAVVALARYAGKVTLVVNVASACGYTDVNYKGLVELYDRHKGDGFEILAFPCNQFGGQEAGSNQEIQEFCSSRYKVMFPLFSKIDVNGPKTDPVYEYLKSHLPESEGGGAGKGNYDLKWNFQKILVNQDGKPVKLFSQDMDEVAIENAIAILMAEA